MKTSKSQLSMLMIRAWAIAKEAAVKFGGKSKDFFSESLKMAWAEFKGSTLSTTVSLIGTENQVEWAEKIRAEKMEILNNVQKMPYMQQQAFFNAANFYKSLAMSEKVALRDSNNKIETVLGFDVVKKGLENLKNNNSAKFWIENRDLKVSALILMNM